MKAYISLFLLAFSGCSYGWGGSTGSLCVYNDTNATFVYVYINGETQKESGSAVKLGANSYWCRNGLDYGDYKVQAGYWGVGGKPKLTGLEEVSLYSDRVEAHLEL